MTCAILTRTKAMKRYFLTSELVLLSCLQRVVHYSPTSLV
jgi:hypothetical protein